MNAMQLYITTCRYIIESNTHDPETWADLHKYLPFLRQSLSCTVCENILHDPMGPTESTCQHHCCRECLGGKMKVKPACTWCKEKFGFVENAQLRIVVQCFRKLCEYLASSAVVLNLTATGNNGTHVHQLMSIIQEGLTLRDDYHASSGAVTSNNAPPTLQKVNGPPMNQCVTTHVRPAPAAILRSRRQRRNSRFSHSPEAKSRSPEAKPHSSETSTNRLQEEKVDSPDTTTNNDKQQQHVNSNADKTVRINSPSYSKSPSSSPRKRARTDSSPQRLHCGSPSRQRRQSGVSTGLSSGGSTPRRSSQISHEPPLLPGISLLPDNRECHSSLDTSSDYGSSDLAIPLPLLAIEPDARSNSSDSKSSAIGSKQEKVDPLDTTNNDKQQQHIKSSADKIVRRNSPRYTKSPAASPKKRARNDSNSQRLHCGSPGRQRRQSGMSSGLSSCSSTPDLSILENNQECHTSIDTNVGYWNIDGSSDLTILLLKLPHSSEIDPEAKFHSPDRKSATNASKQERVDPLDLTTNHDEPQHLNSNVDKTLRRNSPRYTKSPASSPKKRARTDSSPQRLHCGSPSRQRRQSGMSTGLSSGGSTPRRGSQISHEPPLLPGISLLPDNRECHSSLDVDTSSDNLNIDTSSDLTVLRKKLPHTVEIEPEAKSHSSDTKSSINVSKQEKVDPLDLTTNNDEEQQHINSNADKTVRKKSPRHTKSPPSSPKKSARTDSSPQPLHCSTPGRPRRQSGMSTGLSDGSSTPRRSSQISHDPPLLPDPSNNQECHSSLEVDTSSDKLNIEGSADLMILRKKLPHNVEIEPEATSYSSDTKSATNRLPQEKVDSPDTTANNDKQQEHENSNADKTVRINTRSSINSPAPCLKKSTSLDVGTSTDSLNIDTASDLTVLRKKRVLSDDDAPKSPPHSPEIVLKRARVDVVREPSPSSVKSSPVKPLVKPHRVIRRSPGRNKANNKLKQQPKPMIAGCRCGLATTKPGNLTCCGQRCPCYATFRGCSEEDCKCRGCKNPRGDPVRRNLVPMPTLRQTTSRRVSAESRISAESAASPQVRTPDSLVPSVADEEVVVVDSADVVQMDID